MPTSDVRALAEIFSETTMGAPRVNDMGRSHVPGSAVERIERAFSNDSRRADSFLEIFEILRSNRFEIAAGVDCDEV